MLGGAPLFYGGPQSIGIHEDRKRSDDVADASPQPFDTSLLDERSRPRLAFDRSPGRETPCWQVSASTTTGRCRKRRMRTGPRGQRQPWSRPNPRHVPSRGRDTGTSDCSSSS